VGLHLLRVAEQGIGLGPLQSHADAAIADIERRQRGQTSRPGRYWWALEWPHQISRSDEWIDLDFVGPPGTRLGRAFLPASRLLPGTIPIKADPRDGLRPRDWVDYIVPQLGRQAWAADDIAAVEVMPWGFRDLQSFVLH